MPKGGMRAGAGRKKAGTEESALHGRSRARLPSVPVASRVAVPMPEDLSEAERVIWARLMPLAMAAGTLTPETAAAFRDLVTSIEIRDRMMATIEADGWTCKHGLHDTIAAHPLVARWQTQVSRADHGMFRFGLAPVGKPIAREAPDEWSRFDEPATEQ